MTTFYENAEEISCLIEDWNPASSPSIQVRAVQHLFLRDPSQASWKDWSGRTLFHQCCEFDYAYHDQHMDLLQCLLEAHPESLQWRDEQDFAPIHSVLMANQRPDRILAVLKLMVAREPDILLQEDAHGALPIQYACRSEFARTVPILKYLANCCPQSVKHPDDQGKSALHYALEQECCLSRSSRPEVVRFLMDAAILKESIPDSQGHLPLHRAVVAMDHVHPKTLQCLIQTFPKAMRIQDAHRRTPLQLALDMASCSSRQPLTKARQVVFSLLQAWPEQVIPHQAHVVLNPQSYNGELVPPCLAAKSMCVAAVERWTQKWNKVPPPLHSPQRRGPLHYAVVSKSPDIVSIVQHLLMVKPQWARQVDEFGRLPLHYAAVSTSQHAMAVLQVLLEAFPLGVTHVDADGRLAWHYAEFATTDRGSLLLRMGRQVVLSGASSDDTKSNPDSLMLHYSNLLIPKQVRWDIVQYSYLQSLRVT